MSARSWKRELRPKAIMRALERRALDKGYKKLILETGILLKEAMGLYTAAGFHVIENYGPYINMPESVCMEKALDFQS